MNMDHDVEHRQVSDDELKAMLIFLNITVFTRENLKTSVRELLRVNHVDKGGDLAVNQQITRAHRILTACLDNNRAIPGFSTPQPRKPPPDPRASFFDHYNYANKATDDWSEYGKLFRTKKKRNMKFNHPNKFQSFFEDSDNDEDAMFDKEAARARSRPKCYNNNYDYDSSDEFWPNDKQEYSKKDGGAEDHRSVRGGLALRKPLSGIGLPEAYMHLAESDIDVSDLKKEDLETNPKLAYLLPVLTGFSKKPSFGTLIERTQAFVWLDWVKSEQSNCTPYTNVNLRALPSGAVQIYLPQVEEDDIVDDRLTDGAMIQIFSPEDGTLNAKAVVDSVDFENHTIVVKFSHEPSGQRILESGMQMNISMAPGAFIYKAFMRGINAVLHLQMEKFIFPQPEFGISQEEYNKFSDDRISRAKMRNDLETAIQKGPGSSKTVDKPESISFNLLQRQAIDTIVHDACGQYPFVLFGPPGTGKTATLVEAIHQITKLGKEKRILVCATSNMAADVLALTIMKRRFIHPKYVFRLNSLSGDYKARNYKLDPVTCVMKGRDAGYGIPCLRNLQVFRIIVTTLTASVYLNMAGGLRGYFSHIFVDEAGQATEQETWIPIGGLAVPGVTKIALFGDHKQLGAVDQVPILKDYGYATSMLERLMSLPAYQAGDRRLMVMLEQNYRSHELILRPASTLFYDKRLLSNKEDPQLYGMCGWPKLQNASFPLIFHSIRGSRERRSHTHSYMNTHEVNTCLDYVNELKKYNVPPCDIGIISPYRCQAAEIKTVLNSYDKTYSAIAVNSVEGFQGSERRVIILLTTRSNSLGFLYCDKRLNTSITRARELLIVLGDEHLLSQHINWKKLINYVKNHDGFIPSKLMREEFTAHMERQAEKVSAAIEGVKLEKTDSGVKPPPGFESFDGDDDFADPVVPEPVSPPRMASFQFSSSAGGNVPLTEMFKTKFPNLASQNNNKSVPAKAPERPPRFTTRLPSVTQEPPVASENPRSHEPSVPLQNVQSREPSHPPQTVRPQEPPDTSCMDPRIRRYADEQPEDDWGDAPPFANRANNRNVDERENSRYDAEGHGLRDANEYEYRQPESINNHIANRGDSQRGYYDQNERIGYNDYYSRNSEGYDNNNARSERHFEGYVPQDDYEKRRAEREWNRTDTRHEPQYDNRDYLYRESRPTDYDDRYRREHHDDRYRREHHDDRARRAHESGYRGGDYRETGYDGYTDYFRDHVADYDCRRDDPGHRRDDCDRRQYDEELPRRSDDRDRPQCDDYPHPPRQSDGLSAQHRENYDYENRTRRFDDFRHAYTDQGHQYGYQYGSNDCIDQNRRHLDDSNYQGYEGQQHRDDGDTGRHSRDHDDTGRRSHHSQQEPREPEYTDAQEEAYVHRRTPPRDDAVGNYCFDSSFEEERVHARQAGDDAIINPIALADDVPDLAIDPMAPRVESVASLRCNATFAQLTNHDLEAINRHVESQASEGNWMF